MAKAVKLNTGHDMPIFGLGTWKSPPGQVAAAVRAALDCGYRHIDCAHIYLNENEVGEALTAKIAEGVVKREDVFITSKLWNTFHSKARVLPAVKTTLKNLNIAYLDLYLIHWPMGFQEGGDLVPKDANGTSLYSEVDFLETWKAMEDLVKLGLVRSIGVSNFNKDQIERICANSSVVPSVNQVECHPELVQKQLFDYCKSKGIALTAYSPLGSPDRPWAKPDDPVLMQNPKVLKIAEKYNKSAAQILIAFQIQRGIICIPKSVTKARIEANMQVFDFTMTREDMATLEGMDCNGRVLLLEWVKDHPHWPFNTPF